MKINRRHLLALGTVTAAAGVIAVGGVAASWWQQPSGAGLDHLAAEEAEFLTALAEAAYPATPELPVSGAEAGAPAFLDATLGAVAEQPRDLLRLLLHAVDHFTVPTTGAAFRTLSPTARRRVLAEWLRSDIQPVRAAAESLVLLVGMAWSSHPRVAPWFAAQYGCGYGR